MLISLIYTMVAILGLVIIVSLFFKFKSQKLENCYNRKGSINPTHIDNILIEPKDNLQQIRGVGNILERVLNDNGIYYFRQIANWKKEDIKRMDKLIAFPGRIEREDWVEQAKALIK